MGSVYQVGIYLRLSREDEKLGESGSITNQRAILMNYIRENKLEFVSEYVDDGVSGTTFDREGFQRMIDDIKKKKINMVLTKDTSRLGRDHIEFGYYVEKFFPEYQVRYVAVCDQVDTFYGNNDMLLFKSAYNDMYVRDISNKIRASLNIKKKNGEFVGAYAPYGYKKDNFNKHKLVIDDKASVVVKRIFNLFINGNSVTKIAKILTDDGVMIPSVYKGMNRGLKSSLFGVWTSRTIIDILTNPTYMGDLTQGRSRKVSYKSKKRVHTSKGNWIIKENSCPIIISKDVFEMAQNIYYSNKNRYSNKKNYNEVLLKGLVFCKECGHTIGFRKVKTKNTENIYGNCNYYLKNRHFNGCTPHAVNYLKLEKILLDEINNTYLDDRLLNDIFSKLLVSDYEEYKKKIEQDLVSLKKMIDGCYKKIDFLYEDKLNGVIDSEQYLRMKDKLMNEINDNNQNLDVLTQKREDYLNNDRRDILDNLINNYKIDRLLISTLIEKIIISEDGEIDIYYKFSKYVVS